MNIIHVLRYIIFGIGLLGIPAAVILFIEAAVKKKKKFAIIAIACFMLFPICMVIQFMMAIKEYYPSKTYETFAVTSTDINADGYWDVKVSHDKGEDLSPSLSWEPVEGASCYAVYMIDPLGGYWIHMKAVTKETSLDTGAISTYKGPYPPAGVHTYEVYVFALKDETEPEVLPGVLDKTWLNGTDNIIESIDNTGNGDNIISYGELDGKYPQK